MPEFVPRLTLVSDTTPAAWLVRAARDGVVWNFVPLGFEAYVQVLHPAKGADERLVRWREVADCLQVPLRPGVDFQDFGVLADASMQRDGQRRWAAPIPGEIPDQVLDLLVPVLGDHTASEHGWFCLWDGWGSITGSMFRTVAWPTHQPPPPGGPVSAHALPAFAPGVLKGAKVRLPHRAYLLFEGPLEATGELGAVVSWEPAGDRTFERQTPSLWWPDDHAWCAGNEIDATFTCVGGSRQLINALLQHPDLEVIELDPNLAFP